jgi:predicted amidohydrolase
MKIAFVQFDPRFGRVDDNIALATDLLRREQADLYVLPELCFSGYTFTSRSEALEFSEPPDGRSINEMKRLSTELGAAIVFGFPERSGADIYNSCALIQPESEAAIYRKLHLFMQEKEWFKPGDKPLEIHTLSNGCRIGMMVCFDWRFPEVCRTLALRGAHVLCHPANLVMAHCPAAMITRCLENRVFAVTANRYGHEKRGPFENRFTGLSQIVNPLGQVLISANNDKDEICVADIDYRESEDKAVNPLNNIWADRRPEFYI